MKKHVLSIIVTAVCLIAIGVSLFLLLHSQDKLVYCDTFTLKTRQVSIGVGDKLSFGNSLYNISPDNCEVLPSVSCDDDRVIINDDYVTSYSIGSYTLTFTIAVSKDKTTSDTMKLNVIANPDYVVNFTKNEINIYLGEDTACNCLDLYAKTNTTFYSNPIVSYSASGVCELDLDSRVFRPIKLGSTTIKVSLSSAYGLVVSDEIVVNVLPMPEKYISLPKTSDEIQVVSVNSIIEIEYYIMQGEDNMNNQSVTLALYNYDTLVDGYLSVITLGSPKIVFKITSVGSYTLHITSVADSDVSVSVRFEVQ